MNHYEVQQALDRYVAHPILGPATFTLSALVNAVDANSDGWAHWGRPTRAARRLMELIGSTREYLEDRDRADVTEALLRKAYAPLRAFQTSTAISFRIYTVQEWTAVLAAAGVAYEAA